MASPTMAPVRASSPSIEVYFSPNGGCTNAVVREIGKAKTTIRMQAYALTSIPIAEALIEACKRDVDVRVCCDERSSNSESFQGNEIAHAGAAVWLDGQHPIAHSKTIVIDNDTVITGSFNWSAQAEKNLENLLVIRDAKLAAQYADNWSEHARHSVLLKK